jgi:oligoribonuclease NrnB/cAMP/cGMP phosphodiesterase (DHH superfamily)
MLQYYLIEFFEELTNKTFKIIINKSLYSFEDAIEEGERQILLFDTSVNRNRLNIKDCALITNTIKIIS